MESGVKVVKISVRGVFVRKREAGIMEHDRFQCALVRCRDDAVARTTVVQAPNGMLFWGESNADRKRQQ